jgi:hypothetical protein
MVDNRRETMEEEITARDKENAEARLGGKLETR